MMMAYFSIVAHRASILIVSSVSSIAESSAAIRVQRS
jgi:hypothetical protein